MGFVDIPSNPVSAGHLKVSIQLDTSELQHTVSLLQHSVQKLSEYRSVSARQPQATPFLGRPSASLTMPTLSAPAPTVLQSAPVQQMQNLNLRSNEYAPPMPTPMPRIPQQSSAQAQRQAPQLPATQRVMSPPVRQPQPPAPAARPAVHSVLAVENVPRPAAHALPLPAQATGRAAQRAASSSYQQPHRVQGWQLCFTSDSMDHNGDAVQAMTYVREVKDLPSGDGHAGWLISSSRGLLNLWECSPKSIMTMHSQMVDYTCSQLLVEADLDVMFAASTETRLGTECVTVYSLAAETLMAFKYRFNATAPEHHKRGAATSRAPVVARVASLHKMGGFWRNCCATTSGTRVLIYEAPAPGQNTASLPGLLKARQEWKAHDASITAMHFSLLFGLLITGAADGVLILWNLRDRVPSSLRHLTLSAAATGIQLVNEHLLATSSSDGKVVLWDLRKPSTPLQTIIPDGSPVLDMKMSAAGDCLAVSTVKGLHTVDLLDLRGVLSPITTAPLPHPYNSIEWNERTGELYAAGQGGVLSVYRQGV